MLTHYAMGLILSAIIGFWGSQAIIYFYVGQIDFELNRAKRRRNLVSAIKVSTGAAVVVSLAWFLQRYIFG
jgi:hypothetical protein